MQISIARASELGVGAFDRAGLEAQAASRETLFQHLGEQLDPQTWMLLWAGLGKVPHRALQNHERLGKTQAVRIVIGEPRPRRIKTRTAKWASSNA